MTTSEQIHRALRGAISQLTVTGEMDLGEGEATSADHLLLGQIRADLENELGEEYASLMNEAWRTIATALVWMLAKETGRTRGEVLRFLAAAAAIADDRGRCPAGPFLPLSPSRTPSK